MSKPSVSRNRARHEPVGSQMDPPARPPENGVFDPTGHNNHELKVQLLKLLLPIEAIL